MSSTGKTLRQGIKSAVFGDSYSCNGKDRFTGVKQASQVQKSIALHPETRPYITAFIPH